MYVYIYELCINVHDLCVCECVREGEKNRESCVCILLWIRRGSQTLWSCSYGRLCTALCTAQCMWWELNSGPLTEQQTLKHGAISEALRLFCSEANSIPLNLCIYFFPIPFHSMILFLYCGRQNILYKYECQGSQICLSMWMWFVKEWQMSLMKNLHTYSGLFFFFLDLLCLCVLNVTTTITCADT